MSEELKNIAHQINIIYEKIRDAKGSISAAEDDLSYWKKICSNLEDELENTFDSLHEECEYIKKSEAAK